MPHLSKVLESTKWDELMTVPVRCSCQMGFMAQRTENQQYSYKVAGLIGSYYKVHLSSYPLKLLLFSDLLGYTRFGFLTCT